MSSPGHGRGLAGPRTRGPVGGLRLVVGNTPRSSACRKALRRDEVVIRRAGVPPLSAVPAPARALPRNIEPRDRPGQAGRVPDLLRAARGHWVLRCSRHCAPLWGLARPAASKATRAAPKVSSPWSAALDEPQGRSPRRPEAEAPAGQWGRRPRGSRCWGASSRLSLHHSELELPEVRIARHHARQLLAQPQQVLVAVGLLGNHPVGAPDPAPAEVESPLLLAVEQRPAGLLVDPLEAGPDAVGLDIQMR